MLNINMILATTLTGGIGINNQLPWKIKKDLKFFKDTTENCAVIMGRKTWDSIGQKPLRKRINIVITRNEIMCKNRPFFTTSLDKAIDIAANFNKKIFIIGGASIFELAKQNYIINKIYMTLVLDNILCDIQISIRNLLEGYRLESFSKLYTENDNRFLFLTYRI